MKRLVTGAGTLALILGSAAAAFADQPHPWQWRFQEAATGIMEQIDLVRGLHALVHRPDHAVLVLGLLAYCIVKFRASANPVPSRTSHNTLIEVIWTVGPVVVLLFIAVPSFQLLTAQYNAAGRGQHHHQGDWQPVELGLRIPGRRAAFLQFGNSPGRRPRRRRQGGQGQVSAPSRRRQRAGRSGRHHRARARHRRADVIHAFAVPAFGIKIDAVPGRINEIWFKARKEGLYYGQCSELCGKDHAFMPIAVRVVEGAQYNTWLAAAKAGPRRCQRGP
jgi:cytochrome c oxidase subunit 2